ncbi:pentapeptide repeat-containing protein [Xenorhabdus stockiae]
MIKSKLNYLYKFCNLSRCSLSSCSLSNCNLSK